MNIIQIQDRLKGVPDQALVGYVENPTGDVPTYLALGELGRREEMRKKYQAQAKPTETVAEEIVAKAQGLGSIAPMGMTPQLPPQEEVMSESITETGVATLPAPNIGQNYAGGGIVYTDGTQGYPIGGFVMPAARAGLGYVGRGLGFLKDKLIGTKGTPAKPGYNPSLSPGMSNVGGQAAIPGASGLLRQPSTYVIGGVTYMLTPSGEVKEVSEEEIVTDNKETKKEEKTTEDVLALPAKTMQDRVNEFKAMMGESEYTSKIKDRVESMDERAQNREDQALNDALIRGGLGMAAGQSQNFLENLAAGATAGIDSYDKSLDDIAAADEKQFMLMTQLEQAERAEQLAAIQYGVNSEQFEVAEANKQAIQNQKAQLEIAVASMKAQIGMMPKAKDYNTAYNDVLDYDMAEFEAYAQDKGKRFIGSPQYRKERENYIQQRIQQRLSPGSGQAVAQEGFSAVEITG